MKNKYQEALDYFLNRDEGDNLTVTCDWLINAEELKELVDKEAPMKPTHKGVANLAQDGFFPLVTGHCGKCGWEDLTELNSYCSNCGQRIIWSSEE